MATRPRIRSNNGCMACRRRKKKCDEAKPQCNACQRLQLRCFWSSADERRSANASILDLDSTLSLPLRQAHEQSALHKYLDLSPFQDQICAAYALETCFKGSNAPIDSTNAANNGFTVQTTLVFGSVDGSLAWECVFAHGLLYVGYRNQDQRLIKAGTLRSSKTMRNVCAAIGDERKRYNLDTLAAINNLGMMSIIRSSVSIVGVPVENFDHVGGLTTLMAGMDPKQFQEPNALAFFEYIRYGTIVISLLTGRQTFFAQDSWKTIPWARSKHGKSSLHRLVDLLCDITPLQSTLHLLLPRQGPIHCNSQKRLQQQLGRLLCRLHDWRQSLESELQSNAAIACETTDTPMRLKKSNRLFELGIFNMLLIYLCRFMITSDLLLDEVNRLAHQEVKSQAPRQRLELPVMPFSLPIENPTERAIAGAKEILLIWECFVRDGITGNSAIFLTIPIRVAQSFLAEVGNAAYIQLDRAVEQVADFWA